MPLIVPLPNRFNYGTMYRVTSAVIGPDGFPADRQITFDFASLGFIDGSGLTVFCNTIEWLLSHKVAVSFDKLDSNKLAVAYLDDCGLFKRYLREHRRPGASVRSTTLPFTRVAHAEAYGWLEHPFTPWMSNALGVPHGGLNSVRACMKEIFNNITDHSTQTSGFVHVQHYPKMNNVRVTVSDFGLGIPFNVRKKLSPIDDGTAILRATEEGFTTKSTPRNRGVGLDFLIEYVTNNGGTVGIYSFAGSLNCGRDALKRPYRHPATASGSYPGTLVEISLRTDLFVGDDVEEEKEVKW